MPKPQTLQSALPSVIDASVHATAALVLHILGAKRLERPSKKAYVLQLKLLLDAVENADANVP